MTTHRLPTVRRIALTLGLGGLLIAVAACSGNTGGGTITQVAGSAAAAGQSSADGTITGADGSSPSAAPKPVAAVTASPKFGADDISPTAAVTISVAQGTITDLTMTNPAGSRSTARCPPDTTSWTLAEPLGYGKTYTVTGTAIGTDGKRCRSPAPTPR